MHHEVSEDLFFAGRLSWLLAMSLAGIIAAICGLKIGNIQVLQSDYTGVQKFAFPFKKPKAPKCRLIQR
ncbi:hypothetical protein KKF59_02665 [Patescibacteria group bacterium]|nr:hypothetical protein [Patescibacteria group bacterium]MBU1629458.1 hypothetical protein [Patescibacteria group bacterium]MBU1908010.1 hypothetical protein [Patescibacteria group bacterium]